MFQSMFYVICHNIRSLHNVGSIFRTADGAGVSKIFLCGYTPTPYFGISSSEELARQFAVQKELSGKDKKVWGQAGTPPRKEISKVALGAENFVPWEKYRQTARLIKKLKKEGVKIIALEQTKKSVSYDKFKPKFPLALILGEETKGLPKKIFDLCDAAIEIPMFGKKESLNVSVAFGIAAYKILENRK